MVISPGLAFGFLSTFLIGYVLGYVIRADKARADCDDAVATLAGNRKEREREFRAQKLLVKMVDTGEIGRLRGTVIFMEILDYIHSIWEVHDV